MLSRIPFWRMRNCPRIQSNRQARADCADPTRSARSDAEERIDQLLLACSAMWQLLKEKTNLTETDLVTRIALIDAEDRSRGRQTDAGPPACPKCNRIAAAERRQFMYCGIAIPIDNIFKTI